MNKVELIARVTEMVNAEEKVLAKKEIAVVVETLVEAIVETLAHGEEVKIAGLGKFEVAERSARTGRNPQTQEEIQIPASKAPKFKASKTLKEAVNA